mmetsp:Transcript_15200/g.36632  ORF Transcript_15200/g.36632 Transcript_15200/m.36632 type:complete len:354 (-) Transcript_15200:2729-3790(-)
MCKHQRRHRGSGIHHERIGERHPPATQLLDVHELPHSALLSVVRLAGIARSGANTLVLDLQQIIQGQILIFAEPPCFFSHQLVDIFRKRLRKTISQRIQHDHTIHLVVFLPLLLDLNPDAGRDSQPSNVIWGHPLRCDKVRQRESVFLVDVLLITKSVQNTLHLAASVVCVHLDVITDSVARVDTVHRTTLQHLLVDDFLEHRLSFIEQILRSRSDRGILKNFGVITVGKLATHLVGLEERRPIDVLRNLLKRVVINQDGPQYIRLWHRRLFDPINLESLLAGLLQGEELLLRQRSVVLVPDLCVVFLDISQEVIADSLVQQLLNHADRSRGVQDVDDSVRVRWCQLHGGVTL